MAIDYSTPAGQVRLLIADLITDDDEGNQVFNDAQIAGFVALARDGNVKRAAALALRAVAANEVLVQKRIKLLDLSTDGPSEAAALRALAADLTAEADSEDDGAAFAIAEQVFDTAGWNEAVWKSRMRGS